MWTWHQLDDDCSVATGRLPEDLLVDTAGFERLWQLHPPGFHETRRGDGSVVETNRWQQAYGRDYSYSGTTNRLLPTPDALDPYLAWVQATVDSRLNGLLVNWYDLLLGHNIGRHCDSTVGLVVQAPIVTISFGASQVFRLRKSDADDRQDLHTGEGTVLILPWATNETWTHEIRRPPAGSVGRRISITVRAFDS